MTTSDNNQRISRLLYGCGANNYYAINMEVPDPFVWYQDPNGKTHVLLSALEVDRGRKHARVDHVHAMSDFVARLQQKDADTKLINMIDMLIGGNHRVDSIDVPADFPLGLADSLRGFGYPVQVCDGRFFTKRHIKTEDEIEKIRAAQALNEEAFKRAFAILKDAKIEEDKTLSWQGKPLTAEIVRGEMNGVVARGGGMPSSCIVACGAQGADPHERGHGVLKANELIIIDSWPRGPHDNFYHGDLTRTVIKGKASAEQQKLFDAVLAGQELGLKMMKAGVRAYEVHEAIDNYFNEHGYVTGVNADGLNEGFFHSTGHSIGLEVHDDGPGLAGKNRSDYDLEAGQALTVEPGLYYPNLGGVRLEDIVVVRPDGIENLTTLPKTLIIE